MCKFVCLLLFMSFASKPVTEMLSSIERSHIHICVIEPEAKCKSKSRKQLRCVEEVEVEQDRSSISNSRGKVISYPSLSLACEVSSGEGSMLNEEAVPYFR